MKQKNLWILSGVPGAGKSTWVRNHIKESGEDKNIVISRDELRFAMLNEDEDYFARETEVFNMFCSKIQEALYDEDGPDNVFADATHLTEKSRNQVLDRLDLHNAKIYVMVFDVPVATCIKQNANRTGRAFVPVSAIRRMDCQRTDPADDKKYKYEAVLHAVPEKEEDENGVVFHE